MANPKLQNRNQQPSKQTSKRAFSWRVWPLLAAATVIANSPAFAWSAIGYGKDVTDGVRPFASPQETASLQETGGGAAECLRIGGARVLAGELVRQDVRFARLAPETDLGYVPDPGQQREIPVPLPLTGQHPLADADPTASRQPQPAFTVCVERAQRELSRDILQAAIPIDAFAIRQPAQLSQTSRPGQPFSGITYQPPGSAQPTTVPAIRTPGSARVTVLSWQEGTFPEGSIHLPAGGIVPPARGTQEVLWRGSIEYEVGRTVAFWVRVRLERETPCARWRKGVRRGQPVTAAALEVAKCDAAAIVTMALPGLDSASSAGQRPLLAAHDLRPGAWLKADDLTAEPTLRRGDPVALSVVSGGVELALPVVAEQAGAVGERIWVRTVGQGKQSGPGAGRKRMRAVITGPGRVRIDTGSQGQHP